MTVKWSKKDKALFASLDADPKAVYVVDAINEDAEGPNCITAIFSTKAAADAWCDAPENDDKSCVISPYVIDEPDFGNKLKKEMM